MTSIDRRGFVGILAAFIGAFPFADKLLPKPIRPADGLWTVPFCREAKITAKLIDATDGTSVEKPILYDERNFRIVRYTSKTIRTANGWEAERVEEHRRCTVIVNVAK